MSGRACEKVAEPCQLGVYELDAKLVETHVHRLSKRGGGHSPRSVPEKKGLALSVGGDAGVDQSTGLGFWSHAPGSLAMPTSIVAGLREHQTRQNTQRDLAGDRWVDLGFVFATPQGKPLDGTATSKQFHHHLERAGLAQQTLPTING